MGTAHYIRWFKEIRNEDVASVGGKNASLGEMFQDLTKAGVRIPNGFAITADAYWRVVKTGGVIDGIKVAMADLDKTSVSNLEGREKSTGPDPRCGHPGRYLERGQRCLRQAL